MAALVIDASIATAWCFADERTEYTEAVFTAVTGLSDAVAPRLWAYELRNSVLIGLQRGRISKADAEEFLKSVPDLNVRLTDPVSYERLFELADSYRLTVYDAAYLDLAIREGMPIASLDKELIAAAGRCGVVVFRP